MNSLPRTSLVSLVAALGCSQPAVRPQLLPAPAVVTPIESPTNPSAGITKIQDPARLQLVRTLETLGGNLCVAADQQQIVILPFALTADHILKDLSVVDPLSASVWRVPSGHSAREFQNLVKIFDPSMHKNHLPFCFSYYAFLEGVNRLVLPEKLQMEVENCMSINEADKENKLFWTVEKALRKAGGEQALKVCIANYGGEYDSTHVSWSDDGKWQIKPSCFETVAASTFGGGDYGPVQKPYAAYLAEQQRAVIASQKCIASNLGLDKP